MAGGASGLAKAAIAAAALVVGGAVGALVARAAAREVPPPPHYVNPLADAKPNEMLALRRNDGTLVSYRVLEADPMTVLVLEETQPPGQPLVSRRFRVSRTWFGGFLTLEGEVSPEVTAAAIRDLTLESVEPATIPVEVLGRPVRCWKFTGRHRMHGKIVHWVSDELPVHGLLRVDTEKAEGFCVLHGFSEGK